MDGLTATIGLQPVACGGRVALHGSRRAGRGRVFWLGRGHPAGVVDRVRLAGLSGRAVFGRADLYRDGRGRAVGQISGGFKRACGGRTGGRRKPWAVGWVGSRRRVVWWIWGGRAVVGRAAEETPSMHTITSFSARHTLSDKGALKDLKST